MVGKGNRRPRRILVTYKTLALEMAPTNSGTGGKRKNQSLWWILISVKGHCVSCQLVYSSPSYSWTTGIFGRINLEWRYIIMDKVAPTMLSEPTFALHSVARYLNKLLEQTATWPSDDKSQWFRRQADLSSSPAWSKIPYEYQNLKGT